MTRANPLHPLDGAEVASLLFVDDEPGVLNALRRLFRPTGYQVHTAQGAPEGLALLQVQPFDVVVSDMRMPGMDGAAFLERVREGWPDVVRVLLTGYSDLGSVTAAINRGGIFRYVAKPWNDGEMLHTVQDALERRRLQRENARLQRLTSEQNLALKALNEELEQRVAHRTRELQQTTGLLEAAHRQLQQGFLTVVRVLSGLLELRAGVLAGHSRRVADTARQVATAMGADEQLRNDVVLAALLHDIGMIGLSDEVLASPRRSLTGGLRSQYEKHPVTGQMALMEIPQLRGAADLIRHHHERFDGQGFPDGLAGAQIPAGARILAVANDFDGLTSGLQTGRRLTPEDARLLINRGRGTRYDPDVVDAFCGGRRESEAPVPSIECRPRELRPGMVLARDFVRDDGLLLLARGYVLEEGVIGQIRNYEEMGGLPRTVHVRPEVLPTDGDVTP
jgi:response regulator RpfG family c-di-GMP phosphodiesterase